MTTEDRMLSRFIHETGTEPGLARDLLEGERWNYNAAIADFNQLRQISNPPSPPKSKVSPKAPKSESNTNPDGRSALSAPIQIRNGNGKSPNTPKKLTRGFSKANASLVETTRKQLEFEEGQKHRENLSIDTPQHPFILPDITAYKDDFRNFLEKDLIETTSMYNLENAKRLNWWLSILQVLWPMATTGDGNCLLHAASLGMWGFHDRLLTLRKALYKALTDNQDSRFMQKLKRRWRWQQMQTNKESGLVFSEEEWEEEWCHLLKLASAKPRNSHRSYTPPPSRSVGGGGLTSLAEDIEASKFDEDEEIYESLEEFHVFVLAHVIKRPIFIVADTVLRNASGEAFAPIPFGGIYLPLESTDSECHRTPLVLTYDAAHFSALVPMEIDREANHSERRLQEANLPVAVPVTDCDHQVLPIHFSIDPGPNYQWNKDENANTYQSKRFSLSDSEKLDILHRYLDLIRVPIPGVAGNPGLNGAAEVAEDGKLRRTTSDENSNNSAGQPLYAKVKKNRDKDKKGLGKRLRQLHLFDIMPKKKAVQEPSASSHQVEPRVDQIMVPDLDDKTIIVAAKLNDKRTDMQQAMIRNYLKRAQERYLEEHTRKMEEDLIQKQQRERERAKIQAREKRHANDAVTPPIDRRNRGPVVPAQNAVMKGPQNPIMRGGYNRYSKVDKYLAALNSTSSYNDGLSKTHNRPSFDRPIPARNPAYNRYDGRSNPRPPPHFNKQHGQDDLNPRVFDQVQFKGQQGSGAPRNYDKRTGSTDRLRSNPGYKSVTSGPPLGLRECRTPGCTFYGQEEQDFLCSQCFKKRRSVDR